MVRAIAMTMLLTAGWAVFAYSATRRWRLMCVARRPEWRWDRVGERLRGVLRFACGQKRMVRYPLAGWGHIAILFGFVVLLLNALILWGRGYDPDFHDPHFHFWLFGPDQVLGVIYAFLRDIFSVLVIVGVLVFGYYRLVARLPRLTLGREGLVILGIIFVMMVADLVYEGVQILDHRHVAGPRASLSPGTTPFAALTGLLLSPLPAGVRTVLGQIGFWTHAGLVLLFLNLLPYGKHFHVLAVWPNVFCRSLTPSGRLPPVTDIEGRVERGETLGVRSAGDLSWKDVLDFYTCTDCGRCSDHCPATNTGKMLSPKRFSIDLRDHVCAHAEELLAARPEVAAQTTADTAVAQGADTAVARGADTAGTAVAQGGARERELVPGCIDPEVVWACTTCGACETECPVFISYIDKIVELRRNLVMERSEFPEQLQTMLRSLETVGNPYGLPNEQRADWAAGLGLPLLSDKGQAEYLYWVGCAASFDDRSRKIARAFACLLLEAGVDFAILGPQERCTGDPARRAGHEYLFQTLARANIDTLDGYDVGRIVTTCPHCFNTLGTEYPDFGGHYTVVHHTELLAELLRLGRLAPQRAVPTSLAYHDACYLGRHNGLYAPPREILRAIPGVRLVEPAASRDRGMCCGAGGAQMWKEEEPGHTRVNHARARQLLSVLPHGRPDRAIASACPFCKTMLSDALTDQGYEGVRQLDVAEVLWESVREEAPETGAAPAAV
jgi:Fe-S oxidoreductase